ncbi:MAG: phosphoserine phosphatase SerB [Ectothiorhodospiraceae bacterium]|nr:phosphoserine phosphatase SerB [Ectothiorhodospiraceae bacterium]MBN4053100.1 phosphoserine phosphatase SerB [Gammaproteobacteria bacterium AH-315-K14]
MPVTIIHSDTLSAEQHQHISQALGNTPQVCGAHFRVEHAPISEDALQALRASCALDINTLPEGFNPQEVRLLISDMDSTLISIECVDEIADFMGVKPEVAAITEAAMRGELDFAASLQNRVSLLTGLDVSALQRVYDERLTLNPGAELLMSGLKQQHIKCALVSGGFSYFTDRLKSRLNLDFTLANVLAEADNKLLGRVDGAIVDAEVKATYLQQLCEKLEISPQQVIAMGDGANDLKMLGVAGLGVAYHAKPAVSAQADVAIQYRGLDAVLDFLV